MSDEKQFLTVSEFAERVGISKQRVYQLLNKRLKEFVQVVENKKMIEIRALENFNIQEGCSNFQEIKQGVEQDVSTLTLLKNTIDILQKQLDEKGEIIQSLTEALRTEQALHSGSIKQLLTQQTQEQVFERDQEPDQDQRQEHEPEPEQKKEAEASKGVFWRLFKR